MMGLMHIWTAEPSLSLNRCNERFKIEKSHLGDGAICVKSFKSGLSSGSRLSLRKILKRAVTSSFPDRRTHKRMNSIGITMTALGRALDVASSIVSFRSYLSGRARSNGGPFRGDGGGHESPNTGVNRIVQETFFLSVTQVDVVVK
jgi:hypothetical protein